MMAPKKSASVTPEVKSEQSILVFLKLLKLAYLFSFYCKSVAGSCPSN